MSDEGHTPPTCMHCHGELRLGRDSGRWFHLATQRYDCLKSPFDDVPYTMAAPEPEWVTLQDPPSEMQRDLYRRHVLGQWEEPADDTPSD